MPNHQKTQVKTVPPATPKLIKQTQAAAAFFKPMLPEWVFVALTSLFCLGTYFHNDPTVISQWAFDLIDLLAEGYGVKDFYAFTDARGHYCGYDLVTIIPQSIWVLPAWIFGKIGHFNPMEFSLVLVWAKAFFCACFVAICWLSAKISLLIDPDRKKAGLVAFLSASSLGTFSFLHFWGQNDSIWMLLGVCSIYHLIKGNRWSFLIFAGLSLSMKPFFLFPLIVLVCLTEKKLLRIIGKIGFAGLFMIPCKLLFQADPAYIRNTSLSSFPANQVFDVVMGTNTYSGFYKVSIFFLVYFAVCLWALFTQIPALASPSPNWVGKTSLLRKLPKVASTPPLSNEALRKRTMTILYFAFAGLALYRLLVQIDWYRCIFLLPFLSLFTVHQKHLTKILLLLESVMWFCFVLHISITCGGSDDPSQGVGELWCAWRTDDMRGLAHVLFGERQTHYPNLGALLAEKLFKFNAEGVAEAPQYLTMFNTLLPGLFIFCLGALVVLTHPKFKPKNLPDFSHVPRWGFWVRLCSPLFFIVMSVVLYCWK